MAGSYEFSLFTKALKDLGYLTKGITCAWEVTEKGLALIDFLQEQDEDEFSEVDCLGVEAGEVSSFYAILPEMGEEYRDIWAPRCELCGEKTPCDKCLGGE
jgi:hypothetical protein